MRILEGEGEGIREGKGGKRRGVETMDIRD